jgi:hypothetical protein
MKYIRVALPKLQNAYYLFGNVLLSIIPQIKYDLTIFHMSIILQYITLPEDDALAFARATLLVGI